MFASSLVAILNEVVTSGKGLTAHLGTVTKIVKIVKGRAGHTPRPDLLETCSAPPTPLSEVKLQQENGSYSRGFRHQAPPTILSSCFYPAPQSIHNTAVNQRRRSLIYEPPPPNSTKKIRLERPKFYGAERFLS
jgi:hypothetical protein